MDGYFTAGLTTGSVYIQTDLQSKKRWVRFWVYQKADIK